MGRYATIEAWARDNASGFTLNLGCKRTPWGDIRVDIDADVQPDVVANCRSLPFRDGAFETALFTNVLEHISETHEASALSEIGRVLRPGGRLLLTVTNDRPVLFALDPEKWLFGYRYFRRGYLLDLLRRTGFEPVSVGTIGGRMREIVLRLAMYGMFPMKALTGRYPVLPVDSRPDPYRDDESGHTHFIVATRGNARTR